MVHSVYRLQWGKRVCVKCLQSMYSVYKLCTVSTCMHGLYMHNVYRLCSGKRVCAQCLQTMHSVYRLCTLSTDYAPRPRVCTVSADYTRVYLYVHSVYKLCTVSTNYAQCPHASTVSTDFTMASVYALYPRIHKLLCIDMVFVYAYLYTHACAYSYTRVYTYTYACLHVYAYTRIHVHIWEREAPHPSARGKRNIQARAPRRGQGALGAGARPKGRSTSYTHRYALRAKERREPELPPTGLTQTTGHADTARGKREDRGCQRGHTQAGPARMYEPVPARHRVRYGSALLPGREREGWWAAETIN